MYETTKSKNNSNAKAPGMRLRRAIASALLMGLLAVAALGPASALAADPTAAQYGNRIDRPSNTAGSSAPASDPKRSDPKRVGALPFTGADLITLAMVAAGLAGVGLVLRRISTPKRTL